ncbi:hypothetical protein DDP54_06710 [Cellulomonas sp. WB94]|nr:hypothetical protein DDP54_06710 [Cellulomonas sp. WB94]
MVAALVSASDAAAGGLFMVRWLGGAFSDVDPDATAIAFRDAEAFVVIAGFVMPGESGGAVEVLQSALQPVANLSAGAYGNFSNSVAPGLTERMYPPATLTRLRALKREWDPDNLFARNHNVVDPLPPSHVAG